MEALTASPRHKSKSQTGYDAFCEYNDRFIFWVHPGSVLCLLGYLLSGYIQKESHVILNIGAKDILLCTCSIATKIVPFKDGVVCWHVKYVSDSIKRARLPPMNVGNCFEVLSTSLSTKERMTPRVIGPAGACITTPSGILLHRPEPVTSSSLSSTVTATVPIALRSSSITSTDLPSPLSPRSPSYTLLYSARGRISSQHLVPWSSINLQTEIEISKKIPSKSAQFSQNIEGSRRSHAPATIAAVDYITGIHLVDTGRSKKLDGEYYHIKWAGWDDSYSSWEPSSRLLRSFPLCHPLLQQYRSSYDGLLSHTPPVSSDVMPDSPPHDPTTSLA
eukprot:TRINITY_DN2796_c0_g1_i2.p1 TRINITY_DN2796_c0_g1~~TRINITY_DN2796_c0_g1_i2.p1  ORF type:complete len:357 (+),score=29.47 TRINITY_DN2796_c0_g1_i2:75-1073(+)